MKTIERVMRVMTHVNIGATLRVAARVPRSEYLVVSGQCSNSLGRTAATPTPTPAWRRPVALPCCLAPAGERPSEPRARLVQRRSADLLARAEFVGAP